MREFAKLSPQFWTRGSGKKLRGDPDAQVLALYLVTCPSANMIGIYYVPFVAIAYETGLGESRALAALDRVREAGFADYDTEAELAWVPNMASYQIGDSIKPTDNRHKSVVSELAKFSGHRFAEEFTERYAVAFGITTSSAVGRAPQNQAPSKSLRSPSEAPSKDLASPFEGSCDVVEAPPKGQRPHWEERETETEKRERGRGGAPAHTHARAREGQSSDPVETIDPSPSNESGPRTDDRHHDATHAAPHSFEARKTHSGATPIQADPTELATIAATIPDWATAQVGTAQMTAGYRGDPKASWARFVAHIFACRERGEARQLGAAEWLKWLTNEQRYERSNGQSPEQRETAHKPERRILKPAPKKTPEELAAEKEQAAKSMAVLGDFLAKVDAEKAEEERQREASSPPRTRRFM